MISLFMLCLGAGEKGVCLHSNTAFMVLCVCLRVFCGGRG
jgi:hypothetical protein